jgi:flagellar basal-body rod modification protein FlgD
MIDQVASSAASGAGATAAAASRNTVTEQQFLQLFLAQLQHQDPLSPLEPDQMTAQLAQFASLEQLSGVNQRLDQLSVLSQQGVLGLIGKEITFDGSQVTLADGVAPPVGFTLDEHAAKVTATVRGADGTAVRVVDLGALDAGNHGFTFDGKDAHGATLANGTYRVEISAAASADAVATPVSLRVTDVVDGVDFTSDPPILLVGGLRVPLNRVSEVGLAASGS